MQKAERRLTLEYTFDREWELTGLSGNDTFLVKEKEGKAFVVSEDVLLAELNQQEEKTYTFLGKSVEGKQ